MYNNKKRLFLVILLILGTIVTGQTSINTLGNDATGSGGNVAYSIGQVVFTTHNSISGSISQGVQHAFEIYTLGIQEAEINISLKVYPNPTVNNLTLQIDNYNNEQLSYQLFDLQGRLLSSGQVTERQTQINTSGLASSAYFINVLNEQQKRVQTFKIIKN